MINIFKNYFCLSILLIVACNGGKNTGELSTPTAGNVTVSADETLSLLMATEVDTFQSLYQKAKVKISYKAEGEAFKDFISDSSDVIIVTRTLNDKEKKFFEAQNRFPKTTKIAIDAIALIVNKENADTLLTLEQLQDILSGKITKWNAIGKSAGTGDVRIVFDNNNSSTVRYLIDSINGGKPLPANCFAAKSNNEVRNYVTENKNTIGVIGVSWISDKDDPKTVSFLNKVKVVALSGKENPGTYYKPYQAYMQQGFYPLSRYIYMINREARNGLGTGFVSFVAGDKGQRIILKSGLVPATMPVRLVSIGED